MTQLKCGRILSSFVFGLALFCGTLSAAHADSPTAASLADRLPGLVQVDSETSQKIWKLLSGRDWDSLGPGYRQILISKGVCELDRYGGGYERCTLTLPTRFAGVAPEVIHFYEGEADQLTDLLLKAGASVRGDLDEVRIRGLKCTQRLISRAGVRPISCQFIDLNLQAFLKD